jgi:hypothetical protein
MVPGSCQRRDDYYHEPHYTRHPADQQEPSNRHSAEGQETGTQNARDGRCQVNGARAPNVLQGVSENTE